MGKIELDHTGSGGGVTLSSDGTDLLLDGSAIGGGGSALELYAENPSSATTPTTAGANDIAIGSGADTLLTSTDKLAIGTGTTAQGNYATAVGAYSRADGNNSSAAFGYATDAGGQGALALGYLSSAQGVQSTSINYSYSSGASSFAAAIANNTSSYGATGNNSIAIGSNNKATSTGASAIGGYYNQAIGSASMTFGNYNVSSGTGSVVVGSRGSTYINYKYVYSGRSFGTSVGQGQYGLTPLAAATSDATPTVLTTDDTSAGTNDQINLPNNSAYAFHGTIVARQQAADGTACAAWKVEGLIRREANAGTTVLVNSATTVLDNTPNWGMALSADTTNGGLAITCTGAASTDIRWVATIHTSEVTYA